MSKPINPKIKEELFHHMQTWLYQFDEYAGWSH